MCFVFSSLHLCCHQTGAQSHAVNLVGTFLPDVAVYARAGFMIDAKHGVALKIAARSSQAGVAQMVTSSIH